MRKSKLIFTLLIALSLMLLTGSAFGEDLSRFKGKTLTVTCWSGPYLNSFKKAYAEPFMKKSGAVIVVSPGWSEFISKIKASPEDKPPYDVFMADGWNYNAAMNINRLQPIRMENIPNAKDIHPVLLAREPFQKGYGVPLDGSAYLPVYAKNKLGFVPTSWKDLMRDELAGKLSLDATFYYGLYAAAYISDMKPGAEELYTPEGIEQVFATSAALAKRVKKFYKGGAEFLSLLNTGEALMGAYYVGGTVSEMRKGAEIDMIIPEEGSVSWIGYLTVMKGIKNRDLAEAFINFCIDAENQSNYLKYAGNWASNAKVTIPADMKGKMPETNEDFEKITFFDWELLNTNWSTFEERWKKEVIATSK
jgi:putative spermidine/putrescine transport system substrate-binding protein